MERSKVYFTDMRALPGTNLPEKLKKLIKKAGIGDIDFEKKMTAIKIHFGEPGNLSFLRPNYAKAVADVVKELGGRPFLTDCNTLYVGRRKDALEHLSAAYENGFNLLSTGCHIIIGDGLKGTDDISVPVEGGTLVKEAKIDRVRRMLQKYRHGLRKPCGKDGAAQQRKADSGSVCLRGVPCLFKELRSRSYFVS